MNHGVIRFAELADAAAILEIYRPYVEETTITFEIQVPALAEFSSRIASIYKEYPYLVYEKDGRLLGYAYAHRQMERAAYGWNAELSVYLSLESQGQGLGRKFYGLLFEILKLQNIKNVYSIITLPNEKSIKLHESMGFNLIGTHKNTGYKMGCWHDVVWYDKALSVHENNPAPFCSFNSLEPVKLQPLLEKANTEK